MPESSRSLANTREVINTLTNMMNSEDEEVVDAAILALKNLSTAPTVGVLIANCTGLEVPFTIHIFKIVFIVWFRKEFHTLKQRVSTLEFLYALLREIATMCGFELFCVFLPRIILTSCGNAAITGFDKVAQLQIDISDFKGWRFFRCG